MSIRFFFGEWGFDCELQDVFLLLLPCVGSSVPSSCVLNRCIDYISSYTLKRLPIRTIRDGQCVLS